MRNIVFGSMEAFFRFLWGVPAQAAQAGKPEQAAQPSPAYALLMEAKQAWSQREAIGGLDRLEAACRELDRFLRREYFYPPFDPPKVPFAPRQVMVLGFQRPATPDVPNPAPWWCVCEMDLVPEDKIVLTLRARIDRDYGAGFFDAHIVSVRHVSETELMRREVVFGTCDQKAEVV